MSINRGSETVIKQERSTMVTRVLPGRDSDNEAKTAFQLIIQREIIRRDGDGKVIVSALINPPYVFTVNQLQNSPAAAAYVAACGASSLSEMLDREEQLYDNLIEERNA